MNDLISRQEVLKLLLHYAVPENGADLLYQSIKQMPSAQPEIIRCKDCKHRYEDECPMHHVEWVEYDDDGYIDSDDVIYDYTEDDGYCFKAERRTG